MTLPAQAAGGPDEKPPPAHDRHAPAHAPLVIVEDMTYDVLARSDLVITKSGTSTLEAAILQKPMIIVYRVPPLMSLEARLRGRSLQITHIGMPNLLAGERVLPELLQNDANPDAIAELAVEMLLQPERLLRLKERLGDLVRTNLGEPGGVRRAAELLYDLIAPSAPAPPELGRGGPLNYDHANTIAGAGPGSPPAVSGAAAHRLHLGRAGAAAGRRLGAAPAGRPPGLARGRDACRSG